MNFSPKYKEFRLPSSYLETSGGLKDMKPLEVILTGFDRAKVTSKRAEASKNSSSRWWFQTCFNFHPETLGMMIQFDEHIFQMG